MKKITLTILIMLILISTIGVIMIYDSLPQQIPGQFGIDGKVQRYDDKSSIFITAAIPAFILLMMFVLPKIDPKRKSYTKHKKAYEITTITIIVVLIIIQWCIIFESLGFDLNINIYIKAIIGLLFIVLGNYMSQFRQNFFIGIKTPWTLSSEYVWRKTHRVGSYCFIIAGLILILTAFVENKTIETIALVSIFGTVLIPCIYSYFIYKKEIS